VDQTALLAKLNGFRTQAGVPTASTNNALANAAINHAGYQSIKSVATGSVFTALTHFETTDNQPGSAADTGNAMFTGVQFTNRIAAVNGGNAFIAGASSEFEDVSTAGGTAGVDSLWNTVYHRIPMMRDGVTRVGIGDQSLARASSAGGAGQVPASGNAFCTMEFAQLSTSQGTSFWPRNHGGVPRRFDTDTESPDPISGQNTVGPPIHAIFPTARQWQSVNVTITNQTNGQTVPRFILVPQLTTGDVLPTGTDVRFDPTFLPDRNPGQAGNQPGSDMIAGELFVMAKAALPGATTFTVSVAATETGALPATFNQTFTFTTQ